VGSLQNDRSKDRSLSRSLEGMQWWCWSWTDNEV